MAVGGIDYICSLIPHRPPMLLLDLVSDLKADSIICHKRFVASEFFFDGHYPGKPIVPGMILCECAAQAGAVLIASRGIALSGIPVLTRMTDVRFKQMVSPGDLIAISVTQEDTAGPATYFSATIRRGDQMVASLRFAAMMTGET